MPRHLTAVLALALALAAPAAADQWERTYTVTGRPELILSAEDAGVHVTSWQRSAVGIRVTTEGWKIGPGGIRVEVAQTGNQVRCEVLEPLLHWDFSWKRRGVRVEVTLPAQADVDVRTGDGGISLGRLDGSIRVRSRDGQIHADGVRGDLLLSTSDGHIRAAGLDGSVVARTGDGGLDLEGRFDRLEASSGDGPVEVTALAGSRVDPGWSLRTRDGGLCLRLPRTLAADLDVHTGDGSLWVGLPVETAGRFGRNSLNGRLNGGGPPIVMRSGDGPIRLEALEVAEESPPAPRAVPPRAGAPAKQSRPATTRDTIEVEI